MILFYMSRTVAVMMVLAIGTASLTGCGIKADPLPVINSFINEDS